MRSPTRRRTPHIIRSGVCVGAKRPLVSVSSMAIHSTPKLIVRKEQPITLHLCTQNTIIFKFIILVGMKNVTTSLDHAHFPREHVLRLGYGRRYLVANRSSWITLSRHATQLEANRIRNQKYNIYYVFSTPSSLRSSFLNPRKYFSRKSLCAGICPPCSIRSVHASLACGSNGEEYFPDVVFLIVMS